MPGIWIVNQNEPHDAGSKAQEAQRLNQGLEEVHRRHNISKRWGLVLFCNTLYVGPPCATMSNE